jgi:protein-S-isoprenylcysteine O-methyltransferase Ste14
MILWQLSLLRNMTWSWTLVIRWCLITVLFLQFWWAYLKRPDAQHSAEGWKETFFPLVCAALPFVVIMPPAMVYPWLWEHHREFAEFIVLPYWRNLFGDKALVIGLWIMAIGEAFTIWGMVYLKQNFSIMTEARGCVRDGAYRFVRHPLYSGEILSMVGNALFWPSWWNILGALLFAILQAYRAKMEESKLLKVFPEYEFYRKKTGLFFPKWIKK